MSLITFITQSSLLSAGIISNDRYKKYEPYLITFLATSAITFITGVSTGVITAPGTNDQILLFSYLAGVSSYFVLQCTIRLNPSTLLYLVGELQQNLSHDDFINKETKARMKKKFGTVLLGLLIVVITILFSPMLSSFWAEQPNYNDPDFYLLLNTFAYWRVNSIFGLILKNFVHIFILLPGTFCYLGSTALIVCITSNLQAHVAQMNNDFAMIFDPNATRGRVVVLKKDIKILIRYLQYIYRYSTRFTMYVEWTAHTCLFWFMNGLILILHVLIQVREFEVFFLIKNVAILALVFLQFYICCNITESLSHLNEDLLLSMYNSKWYQAPPQLRRTLVCMMTHWQSPLQIKLFNMYAINLALFARCFRIVYSVLNVTLRVQHR